MLCTQCGTQFQEKRKTARFCSERCKKSSQRGHKPSTGLVEGLGGAYVSDGPFKTVENFNRKPAT